MVATKVNYKTNYDITFISSNKITESYCNTMIIDIHINRNAIKYLDVKKQKNRIIAAVTGVVIAGGLSASLIHNNNFNALPCTRMGVLGVSILGAVIPLWMAGKWGSGNLIYSIINSVKRV